MARKSDSNVLMFHDFDEASRTIFLRDLSEGESESDRSARFIKALMILDNLGPSGDKPIHVILNHSGGDVNEGLAIYDAIKAANNPVLIKVQGSAQSMGALILQAGDERTITPNSIIMIHDGDLGVEGHAKNVQRFVEFDKEFSKKLDKILLDRIQDVKPKFTQKNLKAMLAFDTYFTAEQALEHGLVDAIEEV